MQQYENVLQKKMLGVRVSEETLRLWTEANRGGRHCGKL